MLKVYRLNGDHNRAKAVDHDRRDIKEHETELAKQAKMALDGVMMVVESAYNSGKEVSDDELDKIWILIFFMYSQSLYRAYLSGAVESLKQMGYSQYNKVWANQDFPESRQFVLFKYSDMEVPGKPIADYVSVSNQAIVTDMPAQRPISKPLTEIDTDQAIKNGQAVVKKAVKFGVDRAASMIGKKMVDGVLVDNPNAKWSISESTRESINTMIGAAVKNGDTAEVFALRLKNSFAFSDARALSIAQTELTNADIAGVVDMYVESGMVDKKIWVTRRDGRVDQRCLDNEAQGPISIGVAFSSGHMHPLAHPKCRCSLSFIPIVTD